MVIYFTTGALDDDQISLSASDFTELVAVLLAGHPGSLLGIIGLGLVSTFHLKWDEQVLGRIGIGSHIFLRWSHLELKLLDAGTFSKIKNWNKQRRLDACEGAIGFFSLSSLSLRHVRRQQGGYYWHTADVTRTALELPCSISTTRKIFCFKLFCF